MLEFPDADDRLALRDTIVRRGLPATLDGV
jgi:hypothetical protein